jgi:hypothetical protein
MPLLNNDICVEGAGGYLFLLGFSSLYDAIHGWMTGRMDGWMDGSRDAIHGWMTGRMDGWMDGRVTRCHPWMDGWTGHVMPSMDG